MSIRTYDENNVTVLVQYSFEELEERSPGSSGTSPTKLVTVTHSVIAQLPIADAVSLANDGSPDIQDVGPMLTQVHVLGPFKAGRLAVVGGTRKLAAVVSLWCCTF